MVFRPDTWSVDFQAADMSNWLICGFKALQSQRQDSRISSQVGKKLPRGSIKLELKSLKLLSLQASLRNQVEKEQGDIMNMGERAYRKFARNCQASRSNFDRTVSTGQIEAPHKRTAIRYSSRTLLLASCAKHIHIVSSVELRCLDAACDLISSLRQYCFYVDKPGEGISFAWCCRRRISLIWFWRGWGLWKAGRQASRSALCRRGTWEHRGIGMCSEPMKGSLGSIASWKTMTALAEWMLWGYFPLLDFIWCTSAPCLPNISSSAISLVKTKHKKTNDLTSVLCFCWHTRPRNESLYLAIFRQWKESSLNSVRNGLVADQLVRTLSRILVKLK